MPKKGTSSRGKRKSSLLKMTKAASLLRNKNMLMFVFSCYMLSILGYILSFDYQSLTLLLLLTVISSGFTTNMIINLGFPFLFVGVMVMMRYMFKSGMKEGMENNNEEENSGDNSEDEEEDEEQGEDDENVKENYEGNDDVSKSGKEAHTTNKRHSHNKGKKSSKNKQGFSNINNNKTSTELKKVINHYENAQKGFQSAIDKSKMQPQDLEAQQALIKQMGDMTPILKESAKLLERVDVDNLNKLIGGLGSVMQNNPLGVLNQKS